MSAAEGVLVGGPEALEYLDGQCAQDLRPLEVGGRTDALLLAPAGTIVALMVIVRRDDNLVVEVPTGMADPVVGRLERFAIRAAVTFDRVDLAEPDARWRDETARVVSGLPGLAELARDLVPHALAPSLRASCVSFTKGCYPGQELVARMESRHATPPYVLRGLHADVPLAPGDHVGDEARDGVVTSAVETTDGTWHALCVVHRREAELDDARVRTAHGEVVARWAGAPSVRS
jgi:folate-binding protein YgfZ